MKNNLYLFSDTLIKRKDNTILCEKVISTDDEDLQDEKDFQQEEFYLDQNCVIPSGDKKYIPVESIESVFAFGSIRFNSRFMYFLSQNRIPMHIFNFNGSYSGSFFPSERITSGTILLEQATHYNNQKLRMHIAKQFIYGASKNSVANLKYHKSRGAHVSDEISNLEEMCEYILTATDVQELMGIEGTIKRTYYSAWKHIFRSPVDFTHRVKNPPNNLINALISYGNMIVYSLCLNTIYQTRLYPEIGYLHSPGEGKLPLCYDLAEIFKPLFTDRTIFKVINKNIISEKDCCFRNNRCYIKDEARKAFIVNLEEKLNTTIAVKNDKNVSYKRMIKEECYKLIKHLNGEEEYKAYITKW